MNLEALMRLAIDKARSAIAAGQTPFGCAIAIGDDVVAVSHNRVRQATDITAHAEIVALREACAKTGNIHLSGAIVACTCEPCPMCMGALHWARVETAGYGATIADAKAAGFNELRIPAADLIRKGGSAVKLVDDILRDECIALFAEWKTSGQAAPY